MVGFKESLPEKEKQDSSMAKNVKKKNQITKHPTYIVVSEKIGQQL